MKALSETDYQKIAATAYFTGFVSPKLYKKYAVSRLPVSF
jgi:hypothetical protein